MNRQMGRVIGVGTGAVFFLALFLYASGMAWEPLLTAAVGISVIAVLLVGAIWAQERNDAKHAAANTARNRAVEAAQGAVREDLVG